jgi:hypothetical protein
LHDHPLILGRQVRADVFNRLTLAYGGLFNFETSDQMEFKEAVRGISNLIRRWYEIPECQEFLDVLHSGFVVNREPNAFSQSAVGLNVLGIHTGLVWAINELWATLLCHNDFLPELEPNNSFDRTEVEARLGNGIVAAIGFEEDLGYQVRWRSHPWTGLSEFRFAVALALSAMSIEWVFFHELAHLLLGHSKYVASKTGMAFHETENRRREIDLPNYELQGLELDADGVATSMALGSGAMLLHFSDDKARDPRWLRSFYYLWSLSVEGVFRLFSQSTWDLGTYHLSTHPHPFARSYGNWLTVVGNSTLGGHPLRQEILTEYAGATAHLAQYWHRFKMPGHEHDPIHTPALWLSHEGNKIAGELLTKAANAARATRHERVVFERQDIKSAMTFGSGVLGSLIQAEYPDGFEAD